MTSVFGARMSARLWLCIVAVLLVAFGVATFTNDKDNTAEPGATLNRGLSGEPESFDPHRISSNQALKVLRDIGEGLVSLDAAGNLVAGVADSWEISEDGLKITFHINASARWSDGKAVSAKDFEFSLRRLVDPQTAAPYAGFLSAVTNATEISADKLDVTRLGVSAVDSSTLEITLKAKTSHFIQLLAHPAAFPIHQEAYSKFGSDYFKPGNLESNGAYSLVDWILGSSISLGKNDKYWASSGVVYDQVVYHLVDQHSEYQRYLAGDLDVTSNVPESYFADIEEKLSHELKVAPYSGIYYYGFNLRNGPFADNRKLRQAFSMAIDREALVERVTGRGEVAAYSWVPSGVGTHSSPSYSFATIPKSDREQLARKLFLDSGVGPDFKLELRYNTFAGNERIAVAIQSMWRDVLGVEAELVNEEFRVFIDNVRRGEETQIFRLSWTGDFDDPLTFLQLFQSSNSSNLTGYSNREFDRAIERAELESDDLLRADILEDAERIALEDYPVIPLYFYVSKHLVRQTVAGWESNIMDVHLSKHLSPIADVHE